MVLLFRGTKVQRRQPDGIENTGESSFLLPAMVKRDSWLRKCRCPTIVATMTNGSDHTSQIMKVASILVTVVHRSKSVNLLDLEISMLQIISSRK